MQQIIPNLWVNDGKIEERVEFYVSLFEDSAILYTNDYGPEAGDWEGQPMAVYFTLMGRTKKGRRPSWTDAAPGDAAEPVIAKIAEGLRARGIHVEEGRFGAMMEVASVNSGPFTVLVES